MKNFKFNIIFVFILFPVSILISKSIVISNSLSNSIYEIVSDSTHIDSIYLVEDLNLSKQLIIPKNRKISIIGNKIKISSQGNIKNLLKNKSESLILKGILFVSTGEKTAILNYGNLNLQKCLFSYFETGIILKDKNKNIDITNCTFVSNDLVVKSRKSNNINIQNSIIKNNLCNFKTKINPVITYSLIEDGWSGIGNIDCEPYLNTDFTLKEYSPCIDSGNPDTTNLDSDGTRKDIGCFPVDQDNLTASKSFKRGWNWVCFPRMKRVDETTSGTIDTNIFGTGKYISTLIGNPNTYYDINVNGDSNNGNTFWDYIYSWDEPDFVINSIDGYKIECTDTSSYTAFILNEVGALESPDTGKNILNSSTTIQYIGYILNSTEYITDIVPDDLLNYQFSMKHQKWYASYDPNAQPQWRFDTAYTPMIKLGEMVQIKITGNNSFNFQWEEPTRSRIEDPSRPMPEYFTYIEQEDYIPFFVEMDGNLPQEIGVFLNGECKGAAVVGGGYSENYLSQVNVYLLEEDLDDWEENITLQIYDQERGNREIQEYGVYHDFYNTFYRSVLKLKDIQDKSEINLSLKGNDIQNEVPPAVKFDLKNYPNPFNPTTIISFNIAEKSETKLEIYNLKGQLVKTLFDGVKEIGKHSVEWNGTDNSDNKISSGVYMYKLTSGNKSVTEKMVLLK